MQNSQKFVELTLHNNKTILIDTYANSGLIFNENVITESSVAKEKNDATSSSTKLSELTNRLCKINQPPKIELPKVNIETLEKYPRCFNNYQKPINFVK